MPSLVHTMAYPLFGAKPLSESMLAFCQPHLWKQILVKLELKYNSFDSNKCDENVYLKIRPCLDLDVWTQ